MVVPKFWRYVDVPEQSEPVKILEKIKDDTRLRLAPRKFCDETITNLDFPEDTPETLIDRIQSDICHGRDLNHLLWDLNVLSDPSINKKSSLKQLNFVITDGGATFVNQGSGIDKEPSWISADPYNSSLYKMAVLSPHPVIYLEKHADRQVIPIYIPDSDDEETDKDPNVVSDGTDDDKDKTTSTTPTPPPPELVMQSRPPSLYLAQAVRIKDGVDQSAIGVSGLELKASFLNSLLLNATDADGGQSTDQEKPNCRNGDISCYLIDNSGYILASNQGQIQVGDFLGVSDPQLLHHFLDKDFFQSRVEYNYQALCPTKIDCQTDGVAELPRIFLASVFQLAASSLQSLSYGLYGLLISWMVTSSEAASEYTKQVTEGLQRCTTKTKHWEWKDTPTSAIHHDRVDLTCKGIHCVRNVHSYKLQSLNAILVVADPPQWCAFCKPKLIFDGPVEGKTVYFQHCLIFLDFS